ncbi:class I SAM-dependent methyltransferase [Spelaeicoccus albus]|uniref:SAM-dependent methyltransferase n=1 Tax=Spelaeicoccus albus TaxID=1280376 RepID=A0A7Z0CZV0_9MICO|nr:class I SAM-dependent methyltransferase [Spelaeicoccus albus]NYI66701.1 SAM-dependent methyltransferase [Spelaeicoccus albus]
MREETLWESQKRRNPGHSAWYIQRFEMMRERGDDLDGEARLIDALAARRSRILDAGCGPGRVGGELARRGHDVVGVDVDPELIEAAERDYPRARWILGDLTELNLAAEGIEGKIDVIVCAGQVMTFVAPGTAPEVLSRFAGHLAPDGRAVIGFGTGRGYDFGEFLQDADEAGLVLQYRFSTWDLRPFDDSSDFLVAVFGAA